MAMKTILEAIKKHRGQFTEDQVNEIRRAVKAKALGKKKVTGVKAPTYQLYRQCITEKKLDRSKTVWLPPGNVKMYEEFDVVEEVEYP